MSTRLLTFPWLLLAALVATTPAWAQISPGTYAEWIASHGLTGDAAAHTADPDGDGLPNLMEYALDGCNPTLADNTNRTAFVFGRRALAELPIENTASIQVVAAGAPGETAFHVGLRYRPRPGVVGIRYYVELSEQTQGLLRWFRGRNTILEVDDMPVAGDRIGWTIQLFDQATFKRAFLRLRVEVVAD
jgi:hypothetical protein